MMRVMLLLLISLCCFGCISTPVQEENAEREHDAQLFHTQTEGALTLSWESKKDYIYRLYYKNRHNFWDRVESSPDYRGTGKTMAITLKVRNGEELPLYGMRGIRID